MLDFTTSIWPWIASVAIIAVAVGLGALVDRLWESIVWVVPMIVITIAGLALGHWGAGVGLALVWLGLVLKAGMIILEQRQYVVIERWGKYRCVLHVGFHIIVVGVDRVRSTYIDDIGTQSRIGDLRRHKLRLYSNDKDASVKLADCSAPFDAYLWCQIGKEEDIENCDWAKVNPHIKKWVYAFDNPIERIIQVLGGDFRPQFAAMTFDDANKQRDSVAEKTIEHVQPSLEETGITLAPKDRDPFIIEEIDEPESIRAAREELLQGEKEAQRAKARASGYSGPILQIMEDLSVDVAEATRIYETQRGLETLKEVKPSMTMVSKDLHGVLGTINLGQK